MRYATLMLLKFHLNDKTVIIFLNIPTKIHILFKTGKILSFNPPIHIKIAVGKTNSNTIITLSDALLLTKHVTFGSKGHNPSYFMGIIIFLYITAFMHINTDEGSKITHKEMGMKLDVAALRLYGNWLNHSWIFYICLRVYKIIILGSNYWRFYYSAIFTELKNSLYHKFKSISLLLLFR